MNRRWGLVTLVLNPLHPGLVDLILFCGSTSWTWRTTLRKIDSLSEGKRRSKYFLLGTLEGTTKRDLRNPDPEPKGKRSTGWVGVGHETPQVAGSVRERGRPNDDVTDTRRDSQKQWLETVGTTLWVFWTILMSRDDPTFKVFRIWGT